MSAAFDAQLDRQPRDDSRPVLVDAGMLWGCRHRLWLDSVAARLPGAAPDNPGARQRKEAAAEYRARVGAQLTADGGWVVIDPALPTAAKAAATMAACAAGAARIWGAVLPLEPDTGRRGGAEILLRDAERGGYLPVIVVNHKVCDPRQPEPSDEPTVTTPLTSWQPRPDLHRRARSQPRDQLRLAHLYRMLQRHGLASPALAGGSVGVPADCVVVHDLTRLLSEYDDRYAERVAVVRGESPTAPARVPECRNCEWWSARPGTGYAGCEAALLKSRDVSLVAAGSRAEVLRAAGAATVDDLARWVGGPPDDWPTDDFEDVVVAARAWLRGVPMVRRVPHVRVRRADVEVDIDLESFQEHGAYLWGTLLNGQYRPFVTWDPLPSADEGRVFGEFWTWLMATRAAAHAEGKTFAAYCYTRTEDKFMLDSARRFAGVEGVPPIGVVREFVNSREWVDIFATITDQFICPTGKGLKKLAPVAGFRWRDPEAGGEASMVWYRAGVGYDGAEPDPAQRQRVLDYNEDDVRATAALREWMTHRADRETPPASQL
jgi:predicted RecB family nuclease